MGTIFVGTLSDMFGRKKLAIYSMVGDNFFLPKWFNDKSAWNANCSLPGRNVLSYSLCIWMGNRRFERSCGQSKAFRLDDRVYHGRDVLWFCGCRCCRRVLWPVLCNVNPSNFSFCKCFLYRDSRTSINYRRKKRKKNKSVTDEKKTDMKKPNPGPVIKTAAWMSISLINFAVGLQVGHFLAVAVCILLQPKNPFLSHSPQVLLLDRLHKYTFFASQNNLQYL